MSPKITRLVLDFITKTRLYVTVGFNVSLYHARMLSIANQSLRTNLLPLHQRLYADSPLSKMVSERASYEESFDGLGLAADMLPGATPVLAAQAQLH